jgi:hypothetical protein
MDHQLEGPISLGYLTAGRRVVALSASARFINQFTTSLIFCGCQGRCRIQFILSILPFHPVTGRKQMASAEPATSWRLLTLKSAAAAAVAQFWPFQLAQHCIRPLQSVTTYRPKYCLRNI